jgi:hypothetical protein
MRVAANVRRPTWPKKLIGAKKIMFWVYFTPIGIFDIIMLPPGKTFEPSFFLDIVLDSLKKRLASIPESLTCVQDGLLNLFQELRTGNPAYFIDADLFRKMVHIQGTNANIVFAMTCQFFWK